MTYDKENKTLQTGVYEKVKLTHREHELLIYLLINSTAKYEDVLKELGISINNLRRLKQRLVKDTKISIRTITGVGYRLENEIYFK